MFKPQNYHQSENVLLKIHKDDVYDGLNFKCSIIEQYPPSCGELFGINKLSDICVKTNMFSSKKEFFRKLEEGAIKFDGNWGRAINSINSDLVLDLNKENCCEVRYGKKILEIVIAGDTYIAKKIKILGITFNVPFKKWWNLAEWWNFNSSRQWRIIW